MVVSPKYKFVYMNVGKTGSTTIGKLLEDKYEGFVWSKWHSSAKQPICAPQHICHLPEEFADFTVIASVRNPFTHEISRYTHALPDRRSEPVSMEGFEAWLSRKWMETFSSKLNCSEEYRPPIGCVKYKIHHLLHLETLTEDFNNLPFVSDKVEIPHRNRTKNERDFLHYTEKLAEIVRRRRAVDFATFGYSTEIPKELVKIKCL